LGARVSAFALRFALGDMAEMLLTGQRVFSAGAEKFGYRFRYRDLEPALEACKPL
jgi:NAD dependent epimerase/dehydratase family enzyme